MISRLELATGRGGAALGRAWRGPPGYRGFSIMERYRRLRPAPEEAGPAPWATPPEFAGGGDGLEEAHAPSASSSSAPRAAAGDGNLAGPPRRPPSYARAAVPMEARVRTWEPPVQPSDPRSLVVGLAGPPNAGKSSLLNAILDAPISAVSPKVNTTRDGVRGIKTMGTAQLVFLDAPGIVPSHQRVQNRELVSKAWMGYQECDLCVLVIDSVKRPDQQIFDVVRRICPREELGEVELRRRLELVEEARAAHGADRSDWLPPGSASRGGGRSAAGGNRPPVTLVLNKIDQVSEFRWLKSRESEFLAHGQFDQIFYVSAKRGQGIQKLLEHLRSRAQPRSWVYPVDMKTTLAHTEQIKHMVNTHLYKWFNKDVPYKIEQQTVGWTPRLDGTLLVEHELIVKDSIVARMILGVRNTIVARLRDQVSHKLCKLWDMQVEVRIWVRPLQQRLSAAVCIVMSAAKASSLGLTPLATIRSFAAAGVDPKVMGLGPVPATQRCLAKAGWTVADLDLVEANEAFAAQALGVNRTLQIPPEKLNVNGGAIAIGHPIGASGCRIVVDLLYEMRRRNASRGLATLCIGGGQGVAMAFERSPGSRL
ncbi:unnamed protein product [Prorocentrum cordatum]|uniref:G domain-containing protein n=2 Tax=Prorocentrum cordatum TaxID=2364126 RepID=A0ABN9XFV1_9DINO|nr:unnamed protein product [Polarella glacialis]